MTLTRTFQMLAINVGVTLMLSGILLLGIISLRNYIDTQEQYVDYNQLASTGVE